eukprot:3793291-Amphidinium_carterae.1
MAPPLVPPVLSPSYELGLLPAVENAGRPFKRLSMPEHGFGPEDNPELTGKGHSHRSTAGAKHARTSAGGKSAQWQPSTSEGQSATVPLWSYWNWPDLDRWSICSSKH